MNNQPKNDPLSKAQLKETSKINNKSSCIVGWLSILLTVIALGAVAFVYHQQQQLNQQLIRNEYALSQKIDESHQKITAAEQSLQTQLQLTKSIIHDNQENLAKLQQLVNENQNGWLLAETDYLLHLAYFNLNLEKNVTAALILLQKADSTLQTLNNPRFLTLRKMIAKDITALQVIPKVDTSGIYVRLQNLNQSLQQLSVSTKTIKAQQRKIPLKQQILKQPLWKRLLLQNWNTLKSFLTIRHHDQPINPLLLSPDENKFLYLNLQDLCKQAQWALLYKQQNVYDSCLQQIQKAVEKYFLSDNEATQQVLNELNNLQNINVNPTLPDISSNIEMMRKINHSQPITSTPLKNKDSSPTEEVSQ